MLKIKEEHKTTLFGLMDKALEGKREAIASHKLLGLGDKRFRWILYHAALVRDSHIADLVCDILYKYMDDKHLDSVLKEYVKSREY